MTNKISMDKKYRTRAGKDVRILCTDRNNIDLPVVVELWNGRLETYTSCGRVDFSGHDNDYDLIEVSPYEDFKIDDPVMVRQSGSSIWHKRYFLGLSHHGAATTFPNGTNSWTSYQPHTGIEWSECRKPTAEELAK